MTVVLNDPSYWPMINANIFYSYWIVAAGFVVVYDWAITLGQEIELIWRQRWSLITVLYLAMRYIGIPYSIANILMSIPSISFTDAGCNILYFVTIVINLVVTAMLGVVMIARLEAMYQRSRSMLIFLVIVFLVINIACEVIMATVLKSVVPEERLLSGTYECVFSYEKDVQLPVSVLWILNTVWEVLALFLSVWIAVKHFRNLRRLSPSTGSTIGDCFRVLIKSHVLYFLSFVCVSCFQLAYLSPLLSHSNSMGPLLLICALQLFLALQLFVLGPRLILSVREYTAKLGADPNVDFSMNSIVFQERVHVLTSSTV